MIRNTTTVKPKERGSSLIEVLVGLGVFSIMSMGIVHSSVYSHKVLTRIYRNNSASELVSEKIEALAMKDPLKLSDLDDLVEKKIELKGALFTRTTDVTVNPDGTRTVFVSVEAQNSELGGRAEATSTFSPWGTE